MFWVSYTKFDSWDRLLGDGLVQNRWIEEMGLLGQRYNSYTVPAPTSAGFFFQLKAVVLKRRILSWILSCCYLFEYLGSLLAYRVKTKVALVPMDYYQREI